VKNLAPSGGVAGLMIMNVAATGLPACSEGQWLDRCRTGDPQAWRWLYDKHFPLVYRLAIRMGVSDREAADLCQEVFLRIYRGLPHFRGDAQMATWIYRIAANEVTRAARRGALRRALATVIDRLADRPAAPSPEQLFQQAEAVRTLQSVLSRMKPKQRMVFVLFELEELSLEEIAAVVGVGLQTIKSRLRQARAQFERLRRQHLLVTLPGGRA
jgi:RNA polymerase sigma factor (sigma-70 family)